MDPVSAPHALAGPWFHSRWASSMTVDTWPEMLGLSSVVPAITGAITRTPRSSKRPR